MSRNEKGFSVVEILIAVVVVGLIGVVVWSAYDRHSVSSGKAKKPAPYTFKELGISMDIPNGWEVKSNPTQSEGSNFYTWTVQKTGADGKIQLSSSGFRGGFESCEGPGSLTPATVKEVASTQNTNLMFMSWTYSYDNKANNRTSVVPTSETVFRTTNNGSAAAIKNKEVKTGNYFFCLSEPQAGSSLKLSNESAPGFSRKDSITALASSSSDAKYVPLPADAQSYADIKAMLTTIK